MRLKRMLQGYFDEKEYIGFMGSACELNVTDTQEPNLMKGFVTVFTPWQLQKLIPGLTIAFNLIPENKCFRYILVIIHYVEKVQGCSFKQAVLVNLNDQSLWKRTTQDFTADVVISQLSIDDIYQLMVLQRIKEQINIDNFHINSTSASIYGLN